MKFVAKENVLVPVSWGVSITAYQWDAMWNTKEILEWMHSVGELVSHNGEEKCIKVSTWRGVEIALRDDWILMNESDGLFYVCNNDLFNKTYKKLRGD